MDDSDHKSSLTHPQALNGSSLLYSSDTAEYRDLPLSSLSSLSTRAGGGGHDSDMDGPRHIGGPPSFTAFHQPVFRSFGYEEPTPSFDGGLHFGSHSDYSSGGYDAVDPLSHAVHYQHSAPEPPEVPGGYLEPSYHFMTAGDVRPTTVFHALLTHLQQLPQQQPPLDIVVKHDKFKLKCVAYRAGARLPFIVRLFSLDASNNSSGGDGKQYAVEFQRRSGDIMQFSELYRGCKAQLEADGFTAVVSSSSSSSSSPKQFRGIAAPPPLDVVVTEEQAQDTIKHLSQMAASDLVDVKTKAIEALTAMTADVTTAAFVSRLGGLDCLLAALDCIEEDVHRAAVTGVANLTRDHEDASRYVVESNSSLFKLVRSETPHVVRETARAIENIGTALGRGAIDGEFRVALDLLLNSRDPIARGMADRLCSTLRI